MAKENNFEKLRAKIIVRAWKDPRFKEKLLKNPRAAFKEMGLDFPENFQVKVVEDRANAFTFVLPPAVAKANELSDQELERLAGGASTMDTNPIHTCHCFGEAEMAKQR